MFEGVMAPLTTPFTENGEVDFDAHRRNLEQYLETELTGFLVAGSTGEGIHLSYAEKEALVRETTRVVSQGRKLLVGVSSPTLSGALDQLKRYQDLPISAALLAVPSYYRTRMSDQVLEQYFVKIAEQSPLPLLLYNIPQLSGIELSIELVGRLAAHPRIIGMKDSSGNLIYLQGVLNSTDRTSFQLISGSAETFGLACRVGIASGILAAACAVPQLVQRVIKASSDDALQPAQAALFDVGYTIVRKMGVPGVKYAMDVCGYEGGYCRSPLLPLGEIERSQVRAALERNGCL